MEEVRRRSEEVNKSGVAMRIDRSEEVMRRSRRRKEVKRRSPVHSTEAFWAKTSM